MGTNSPVEQKVGQITHVHTEHQREQRLKKKKKGEVEKCERSQRDVSKLYEDR